jgi:hypothetical protein
MQLLDRLAVLSRRFYNKTAELLYSSGFILNLAAVSRAGAPGSRARPGLRRCARLAEPANGTSNWQNVTSVECPFVKLALCPRDDAHQSCHIANPIVR